MYTESTIWAPTSATFVINSGLGEFPNIPIHEQLAQMYLQYIIFGTLKTNLTNKNKMQSKFLNSPL